MNEASNSSEECSEDEQKDYDMVYMLDKKVEWRDRECWDRGSTQHRQQKQQNKRERVRHETLEPHFGKKSTSNQRDYNLRSIYTAKDREDQIDIDQPCPTKNPTKNNENNDSNQKEEKFINQKIASTKMNDTSLKDNKYQINQGNPQYMNMSKDSQRQQEYTRKRKEEMQKDRQQILLHILATVERNRTFKCQYLHFLLPYALALLAIHSLSKDPKAYYMKIYFYVLKKLNRQDISSQISSNQVFCECINYLIASQSAQYDKVLTLLSKFLKSQAEMAARICPYYYNFFAFFANSPILFGGNESEELVKYSINYQIRYYNTDFTEEDVKSEIERMEKALAASYKSEKI